MRARPDEAPLRELLHPLAGALTVAAIAGKLACAFGVVGRGIRRLPVAFTMLPRGEVGLIFAGVGSTLTVGGAPLLDGATFSSIVTMVLVTTLIAPLGLRWSLRSREAVPAGKDST